MDFQPQFFGSLTELITVIIAIFGGFWWLKRGQEESNQRLEAIRQWQDAALERVLSNQNAALEKILAGQNTIITACERVMEQLVNSNERLMGQMVLSNEKILEAFNQGTERHGKEHSKISERLLRIALHKE